MRTLILLIAISVASLPEIAAGAKPNIVVILADDMGIDSVGAFNGKLGLKTPNIDRLAREGMSFMDAHSSSAVCSPTRYGLLTGRYNWRSRLKRGIVGTWERPLIAEDRLTLPSMLRQHGYATTMIGKWHLGHHWPKKGGGITEKLIEIDFTAPIKGGPTDRGFDYWFGDDVPNWPPYAWRENDRLLGEITTTAKALGLTASVGVSNGPAVAGWKLEAVLPEYAKRCSEYILDQGKSDKPFFLYFPMPSPHTPIAPNEEWKGKSGVSEYADFLLETDWAIGELLKALDQSGQADNTLVIFTTDNGTSPKANFSELDAKGVHLNEHWRGYKADAFEGGHRSPFIVRWPGQVDAGTRSNEAISLVDIMATLAEVVGHELPANAAEDSASLLPLLRGKTLKAPLHEAVVCHSVSGHFALRSGKWKVLYCQGSGGWSNPREAVAKKQKLPSIQLYDLEADPKETTNLQAKHPEVVSELTGILRRYVENGRSTPGPPQSNHAGVNHWGNLPWAAPSATGAVAAPGGTAGATISTPDDPAHSFRRIVEIRKTPANGRFSLPAPFPNIVRAWRTGEAGAKAEFLKWTFNQDASEIDLLLPKATGAVAGPVHLLTAERSGRQPDGTIVLSALDARVVGEKAQLETHPGNHRIGFWVRGDDYVTWTLEDEKSAGSYNVELVYSRAGTSGAKVAVKVDDATLPVTLASTGSWYVYQVQPIGSLELTDARARHIEVRSTLQIGPVMNLKAIVLHPHAR